MQHGTVAAFIEACPCSVSGLLNIELRGGRTERGERSPPQGAAVGGPGVRSQVLLAHSLALKCALPVQSRLPQPVFSFQNGVTLALWKAYTCQHFIFVKLVHAQWPRGEPAWLEPAPHLSLAGAELLVGGARAAGRLLCRGVRVRGITDVMDFTRLSLELGGLLREVCVSLFSLHVDS